MHFYHELKLLLGNYIRSSELMILHIMAVALNVVVIGDDTEVYLESTTGLALSIASCEYFQKLQHRKQKSIAAGCRRYIVRVLTTCKQNV